MKKVVPANKFEETVPVNTCDPAKLIAVCEGFLGIVEFRREEGIMQYRIYWNNGNFGEWYVSLSSLLQSTQDSPTQIFQL